MKESTAGIIKNNNSYSSAEIEILRNNKRALKDNYTINMTADELFDFLGLKKDEK